MFSRGNIVQLGWHSTPEGENMLQKCYYKKGSGRKPFGILERPTLPGIEEVSYKLHFLGKSGVGKTSVVARLAGLTCLDVYVETCGIRVTDIYWPVKIWDKIIVFKLQCWESGANCMKKYSHINTACNERVDLLVHMFSFNDKSSFSEVMQSVASSYQNDLHSPASIALGTRFNINSKLEVSNVDVRELETKYNLKILSFPNATSGYSDLNKIIPILNTFCEHLWIRDQHYILNQGVTV